MILIEIALIAAIAAALAAFNKNGPSGRNGFELFPPARLRHKERTKWTKRKSCSWE